MLRIFQQERMKYFCIYCYIQQKDRKKERKEKRKKEIERMKKKVSEK